MLQNVFCRVPSQKWNKLLRKERPFIEHNLLTPVPGNNRKRMQRSSLSLPFLSWSNSDLESHITSYVNEVVRATLLMWTTSGRRGNCHLGLFHCSWRLSVWVNRAGWLDYTQWDRSHLWATSKLLSAKMNILIRQLSSQTICSLVKFERQVDCF